MGAWRVGRRVVLALVLLPAVCVAGTKSAEPRQSSGRSDGGQAQRSTAEAHSIQATHPSANEPKAAQPTSAKSETGETTESATTPAEPTTWNLPFSPRRPTADARYYRRNLGYINHGRRPIFVVGGYIPFGDRGYSQLVPTRLLGHLPPPPPGYFDG